jgi:hypothetical protein
LTQETEMILAIRAWLNCPAEKRPSARSLGERIAQIASDNPQELCRECGGDGHFEEVAQGPFGAWEMQQFKCRACDGAGWITPDTKIALCGQK